MERTASLFKLALLCSGIRSRNSTKNAMESSVIKQTAPTLLDCLVQELGLVCHVRHNVEDAADALSGLKAARNDLSDAIKCSPQQMRPEQVDNWFKSVDEVDKKITKVQRDYTNRCLCACSCSPNIFSSYAISRRAFRMLERVKALRTEYVTVKNLTGESPPASCIPKPVADVFVGKSPDILAQLLSYLEEDEEARIISICGMAGVGKSELMRRLNNKFLPVSAGGERAEVFKFVVWVHNASSEPSDVSAVQDEIARRLKLGDLGPADRDAEARAGPIFSVLKDASFLVLLDNVMASVSLADIGIPNPVHRRVYCKQKVVLTTRFEFVSVCAPTGSCFRRIDVECLDWDASWELFKESVGQEQMVGSIEMMARLGEQVARECGGLPIALEKIGRAMSTRLQPGDWKRTAEFLKSSRIHQIPGMETDNTELLRDLKKSYDHGVGSDRHRECFLCCALWPRGGSISKAELVECWIGLGLIRDRESSSHEGSVQTGLSIISILQEANLLLPGENAEGQVKLQEVVRDMALWIARDCGSEESKWVVQAGVSLSAFEVVDLCEGMAAAQRVSLMHSSIQELPQSDHWTSTHPSRLALLMLQHNPRFTTISGAFLGSASAALAYLDLSHTAVEELPEEVGTLAMLEYLNLSFTPLKALPGALANLGRLKHLFLNCTPHLSTIPAGVFRGLTSVRVIDMYPSRFMDWEEDIIEGTRSFALEDVGSPFIHSLGITINSILTVQRLGRLDNVCTRRLLMTRFRSPSSVTLCPSSFKCAMGSFSLLETLLELSITECDTLKQLVFDGEEQINQDVACKPDKSWCLRKLKHLELCGLTNLTDIIWKRMSVSFFLGELLRVKIGNCSRLTNVSWVIQLHFLQHLELRDCATMESVVDARQEQHPPFPSLMTLVLVNLPVLRIVCTQQVSFPRLEGIQVGCCNNLRRMHIKPQRRLQIQGTMDWWRGIESEWNGGSNNVEFMETIVV